MGSTDELDAQWEETKKTFGRLFHSFARFLVSFPIQMYKAYIISVVWVWFAVETLNAPAARWQVVFCLLLLWNFSTHRAKFPSKVETEEDKARSQSSKWGFMLLHPVVYTIFLGIASLFHRYLL